MVDVHLPLEDRPRPLRSLFLDLNAYFASVEQQERPELRGRPIAVVPVMADSSFVIAASYEAKRFGIKTQTRIGDAKQMCPGLELVQARPAVYVGYHHRIMEVAETVLPIEEVCSIDEMRFELIGEERSPARARELALQMKQALREGVGECIRASIGIAPNPFLAKVATDMMKPDGLVTLQADDLPHRLYGLSLTDFAGINRRMALRLNASGIFTAEDLCRASKRDLFKAFGGIIGERWWYQLRGFDVGREQTDRKSLGHSHVLPPELRNDRGCREVLLRLLQKASARLRTTGLYATTLSLHVSGFDRSWSVRIKMPPTQDTVTMNEFFLEAWEGRNFVRPRSVGITFTDLRPAEQVTGSLFDSPVERAKLNEAVDEVNRKFGKNTIFLAGMERAKDTASEKIAFNKTWLFQEGKGDNEWVNTFRGLE